ncbi:MAG: hypothetical protein IJ717_06815 [Treponema sp.]|nr:hypothetical protein [Treponema sp.]
MESMKNIKKPAYAVEMGQGMFAGTQYIYACTKCKMQVGPTDHRGQPSLSGCPAGGSHEWKETSF